MTNTTHKQQSLRGLYVITDWEVAQQAAQPIDVMIEQAIRGGARIVQYRNKHATPSINKREAGKLAQLCRQYQVTFLINDDVELAMHVGADGVHLGQTDMPLLEARKQLGQEKMIGITCHDDLTLAQHAQENGADYVAFGRFFPSRTKPNASIATMNTLIEAKQLLSLPVCAIGGITPANALRLINHGADMIAVIHAVLAAAEIEQTARLFTKLFK